MKKKVYFIGIGGIGISALSHWFLTQNWLVFGSDLTNTKLISELKKDGVEVKIGHKKANLPPETALVIYNQAIKPDNPELLEAKKRGIKTLTYPQFLGELTHYYKTIAVSGAHGKSTTTALISLILIKAGFDPTVIIGAKFKESNSGPAKNFRAGKSKYLIIEADEWKAAFLNYSPALAVITNIDCEHLDYYKNLTNIKNTFLRFMRNIRPGGILVLNKDNKNLTDLVPHIKKISQQNNLKFFWYGFKNPSQSNICRQIKKVLKVAGQHNLSNALAAYVLAKALKIKTKTILKAIGNYTGAWRRMEYKGILRKSITNKIREYSRINSRMISDKIPIYDDYAHHPTEIKATIQAFKEKFPNSPLLCVFQPHQAKRLKLLFKDFIDAFDLADVLILLPIYQVAGRDKIDKRFNSETLAEKITGSIYLKNPKQLPQTIKKIINLNPKSYILNSPIIIMMGAGDIDKYTNLLVS